MDQIDSNPTHKDQDSRVSEKLAEIGEKEILNRLKGFMPIGQIDDDTAELNLAKQKLLINTDLLVEDIHFSQCTTKPEDIGWRATTANLSDLAASGASQVVGITVGLVAPSDTNWEWVKGVYTGISQALEKFGGDVLGGDCSNGQQKMLSITAFGKLGPLRLHRSYAQPGDSLVVSNSHGLSRLGLAILMSDPKCKTEKLPENLKRLAVLSHQRPEPPFPALRALEACKPNGLPWRAAGTDSSDGLLEAINSICNSSGCQAVLDENAIPRNPDWPIGDHWDEWCINGGEDFELVLSLPDEWAQEWIKAFPSGKKIGSMQKGKPEIKWRNKEFTAKQLTGYKHF